MTVLQSSVNWVIDQARLRLGDPYVYGGFYSPTFVGQGCDCSGCAGWALEALTDIDNMDWRHDVSTESWPYDYNDDVPASPGVVGPYGTIAVKNLSDIPADAAATVNIMHGGGGAYSHMNIIMPLPNSAPYEGVIVESNGDAGSCTNGSGANPSDARLWTDHWFLPGPWVTDAPPGAKPVPTPNTRYVVQSGDTMSSIANSHGVTLAALERANPNISNPNLIFVGETVVISVPT
jgi:LysM domain